ncbi:hypothetical protein CTKA_02383 [Chthonomonas calidirosea]|uniref:Uncharacterized protein n=1 Tax=Chthonomonas calidirosea (strain DSM 23976 / ICMP 18418 / T49) TaxID=1303518 RepID=S0EZ69_CHTCT|nr:hypothetical protein [Chthonomonas calidirosea]CCW35525.1 hypothetical protein CCALI_01712 [Chthonomonas calidirosea T49]CEK20013.1 hypothetical protein CTKA_02383 [Chthonomonas calidirosea]
MARNQKLTSLIQGRTIASLQPQSVQLLITFTDGSKMTVRVAEVPQNLPTGGTVKAVRQSGTTLELDMVDGSTLVLQTAEATSCVLLRNKHGELEYAD